MAANLNIIFENENYIIINKPSGINSVKVDGGGSSIADLLIQRNSDARKYSVKPEDGGLVQRLDFETSGILIAAKSSKAWVKGREILLNGEIYKSYLVIVEGELAAEVELDNFIGSPNRGAKKVKVFTSKPAKRNRALPAHSKIIPLSTNRDRNISLARVEVHSARRHQVRAHLSFIEHPLCGDLLYGSKLNLRELVGASDLPSFFLHAERAKFTDPLSAKVIRVTADVPEYFQLFSLAMD